jgi:hypothetical protein
MPCFLQSITGMLYYSSCYYSYLSFSRIKRGLKAIFLDSFPALKSSHNLQTLHQVTMRFQTASLVVLLTAYLGTGLAVPFPDPDSHSSPIVNVPKLESRETHPKLEPRQPGPPTPSGGPPANCPSQKPIAQNLCTSGSPYCCSGSGSGQVCGLASSVSCSATTICCINTNGVSRPSPERRQKLTGLRL